MHGDATRRPARLTLHLPSVKTDPHLQAALCQRVFDRYGEANCTCRPVEKREEPVPSGVYLLTPEPLQLSSDIRVMRLERARPCFVAHPP